MYSCVSVVYDAQNCMHFMSWRFSFIEIDLDSMRDWRLQGTCASMGQYENERKVNACMHAHLFGSAFTQHGDTINYLEFKISDRSIQMIFEKREGVHC
jgi:hypothetical protein